MLTGLQSIFDNEGHVPSILEAGSARPAVYWTMHWEDGSNSVKLRHWNHSLNGYIDANEIEVISHTPLRLRSMPQFDGRYHHSASNREIAGVIGIETDINFYPSDTANGTNFLNEAGIVTCMRSFGTGFRSYGNRSAAFPTSSHVENFINARRILDQLHDAITFFSMQYVDRLGTPQNVEALEEAVNAFLRKKTGDGVLFGGTYRFDRKRSTPAEIADGHFHYKLECHPTTAVCFWTQSECRQ